MNNFPLKSLLDSLKELGEEGLMPLELIPTIVQAYDKAIFREVSQSTDEYTVTGVLKSYRLTYSALCAVSEQNFV